MAKLNHGLTRLDNFTRACANHQALNSGEVLPQLFGRLAHENPLVWELRPNVELVEIFEKLIDANMSADNDTGGADAGLTFFGQFVDHDITLDATSAIGTAIDPRTIRNVRTPSLDLDCVYGDGPEASPHQYGEIDGRDGYLLFGRESNPHDLARNCKGRALIGDFRNDENIFVSQIQGAFICLHNILLHEVYEGTTLGKKVKHVAMQTTKPDVWSHETLPQMNEFQMVRHFIRLHYQWLVINEFLPAFVDDDAINAAFGNDLFGHHLPVIPVEFSGAVYRFGHATVQQDYKLDHNSAPIHFFEKAGFGARETMWTMNMQAYFSVGKHKAQRARKVGMTVAKDLFKLPFVNAGFTMPDGTPVTKDQAAKLPLRNILRDRFALHLPSGQELATKLGLTPKPVPKILADENIKKTPLWFYILEEADHANGKLTGVGGRICAAVFRNLLKLDTQSYFHLPHFAPEEHFDTLGKLMAFVEEHRDAVPHREELYCGPDDK